MVKIYQRMTWLISLVLFTACTSPAKTSFENSLERNPIYKKVLSNGLTVIVRPIHDVPRVAVQLWYHVGSKDEQSHERGKAHMLEHMVFKGTQKISESDIGLITQKLSGYCNAFTSYDYTAFVFNLPNCHWHHALEILSDCMTNCTFKDDLINAELKTVIQELKGNRDNYPRSLFMKMMSSIFENHPYHYPVIGYKQDLWNMNSDSLKAFYKKHYWPNNATLVVVGDVDAEELFEKAEHYFGNKKPNPSYKKETFYHTHDIAQQNIILHRDIQLPHVQISFTVPGAKERNDHAIEALSQVLANGQSSRLYHLLVDKHKLVSQIGAFHISLIDHGLFCLSFIPYKKESIEQIGQIIEEEIEKFVKHGFEKNEKEKIITQLRKSYIDSMESYDGQANQIGKYYLATQDEQYVFRGFEEIEHIEEHAREIARQYLRPSLKHVGSLLPINPNEKKYWQLLQEQSDIEDQKILATHIRASAVEPGSFVNTIEASIPPEIALPEPDQFKLDNNICVYTLKRTTLPKVEIILTFKASDSSYDPEQKQGLYRFMTSMLLEGSTKKTGKEIDVFCQLHGITLFLVPGALHISVLKDELPAALEMVHEILTSPAWSKKEIEKVRTQILASLEIEKDNPSVISSDIISRELYPNHPYGQHGNGTTKSIKYISRKDLINFHKTHISADGAAVSIVGDFDTESLKELLNRTIGKLPNKPVQELSCPSLPQVEKKEIVHPLNRDQITIAYAGLSVKRTDPDYVALLLFNNILSSGLSSKLFKLRMQTGLYYYISGNMIEGAAEEPGMAVISMLVSKQSLDQAQQCIEEVIDAVVDTITEQELHEAKQSLIYSLGSAVANYSAIASMYSFLHRYNLPISYVEEQQQRVQALTLAELKEAVKRVLNRENMVVVKVGRQ